MSNKMEFLVAGLPEEVAFLEARGEFKEAGEVIRRILNTRSERLPSLLKERLEWELERIERIKRDYPFNREKAFNLLKDHIPDLSQEDFEKWIKNGFIERKIIDGEEKFFANFIPNLFRDCKEASKRRIKKIDETVVKSRELLHKHIDEVVMKAEKTGLSLLEPVKNRVVFEIKVKPGMVPEGEIVRVWMPFPKKDYIQPEVKLISANPKPFIVAPEESPQRTIYFEAEAKEDEELVFRVEYEYTVYAFYRDINPDKVTPYEENDFYDKYTSEELPHIAFTPYLRKLADEIVKGETNPYFKAWRIYKWITYNVRYALVREYSTFECISEYVARNLKGDCGFQALLFITLCRISGVPARWQSGWYLNPIKPGMHDWAQFYIEPYGWLYVDPSFGGARKNIEKHHRFYFGNIDHFRLICNTDISSDFHPPKRYYRSDTVDNQRGEVEYSKGNLYYDKWSYKLQVVSHEKVTG